MKYHYIKATDGSTICATEYNRTNNPEQKSIVLVHGWPLNQKQWDYLVQSLLDADIHVITFDLRGFGKSDCAYFDNYYKRCADDILQIVSYFRIKEFTLCGFSMGGAISVQYMADYGNCVDKLILLDAAIPSFVRSENNPDGWDEKDVWNLIEVGNMNKPELNKRFGDIFFHEKHTEEFKNWIQRIGDEASQVGEIVALHALKDEDLFDKLSGIKVPTLILHGIEDKICKIETARIAHKQINGSKLLEIPDAGHGAFADQMELTNENIVAFTKE